MPAIPDDAGLVQAVTEREKAAQRSFLTYVAEAVGVGTTNTSRAERSRLAGCRRPDPG